MKAVFKTLKLKTDISESVIDKIFDEMVTASLAKSKSTFLQQVNGLSPIDFAVLKVMASEGKDFSPYTKASYATYKACIFVQTGEIPEDVHQSSVQQALERLRAEKFVWRAGRGAYFIEDAQHAAWIGELIARESDDIESARKEINARLALASIPKSALSVENKPT